VKREGLSPEISTKGPLVRTLSSARRPEIVASFTIPLRYARSGSALMKFPDEVLGHAGSRRMCPTGARTMNATEQVLIDKIRQLPPQRVAEVEDFVDFLRAREEGLRLAQAAAKVSEGSFRAVWDNDDDAAYDRM
jgi:hypothetical protein